MPSVNDMVVHQAATILNQLQQQATGQATGLISTRMDFVSAATTLLKSGYDPIMNALSQMWTRTIFSVRPYSAKFPSLEMDADRWGNATRKVSFADKPVEDDERFLYPVGYDSAQDPANGNGLSVDMFKLHKDDVQQVAFYGQSVYEDARTIFRDNLDVAFTSPEEFMRYNAAAVQARSNKLEQYREDIRRGVVCNAITAVGFENQNGRVVHLITEYNTELGASTSGDFTPVNAQTVMQPDNFAPFIRWLYAKITTIARRMGERSNLYQTVVDGKQINRHTPSDRLRIYILSELMDKINAIVRSTTYHDDYLRDADWEGVTYWQHINNPQMVNNICARTDSDGNIIIGGAGSAPVQIGNVVGIMFDADAMGSAITNYWSSVTPFNAAGGYWNDFIHANFRTRFDMTEKIVLLLLD